MAGTGNLGQNLSMYPHDRFGERYGAVDSWQVVFDQVVGLSVEYVVGGAGPAALAPMPDSEHVDVLRGDFVT